MLRAEKPYDVIKLPLSFHSGVIFTFYISTKSHEKTKTQKWLLCVVAIAAAVVVAV